MEIIETDWGIANTIDNKVYINSKLNDYPELKEKIIKHETEHYFANKEKGFKKFAKNRKIDALTEVKFKDLFPFIRKNPRTFFQQYLPISYSSKEDTVFIEWSLVFLYGLIGFLVWFAFKLVNVFSDSKEMFWLILKNTGIILGIIIVLYFIGGKIRKSINKEADSGKKVKLNKRQRRLKKLGVNPATLEKDVNY